MTTTIDASILTESREQTWDGDYEDRGRSWQQTEPHLLLLLMRGSAHGYDLLAQLAVLGFRSAGADQGAVYRTLRKLEEAGCVISRWETGASGPARRMYEITAVGQELLHRWALAFSTRKVRLERFLEMYSRWTDHDPLGQQ